LSADAIRLRREVEKLIKVVEEQGKRIAAIEILSQSAFITVDPEAVNLADLGPGKITSMSKLDIGKRTLSLNKKDAKANG
jgi:hypothetical protein